MSEDTYADNLTRGDLEKRKFEANTDGDTAVRTTGGVADSAGRELTTLTDEHFKRLEAWYMESLKCQQAILNQLRLITGTQCDAGETEY
jgi:hypothetical protein